MQKRYCQECIYRKQRITLHFQQQQQNLPSRSLAQGNSVHQHIWTGCPCEMAHNSSNILLIYELWWGVVSETLKTCEGAHWQATLHVLSRVR